MTVELSAGFVVLLNRLPTVDDEGSDGRADERVTTASLPPSVALATPPGGSPEEGAAGSDLKIVSACTVCITTTKKFIGR